METYVIHVTKECNCDCTYCYEDDKTSSYTWEEVRGFIDNILKFRTSDSFNVEFLGGEPLLAWDLIKKSYEYLEELEDIYVGYYCITTNGTIITEEIADYLSKNKKIGYAVSLDGHKWANQLRVFKESRENTYDKVMENILFLREYGVEASIHMVTHLYNVSTISSSIDHLYKQGLTFIDLGTIEKTMIIDQDYCDRFIKELDIVSKRIIEGTYPDLSIGLFNNLKPKSDVRSYIKDPVTGKTIGETYGRSGSDITHTDEYEMNRCTEATEVSEMIYHIRETVYNMHQNRLKEVSSDDN